MLFRSVNAINLINRAFALGDEALGLTTAAPQMSAPTLDKSYLPPVAPVLPNMDPNEGMAIYQASKDEIEALIASGYGTFLQTYFPDGQLYQGAIGWIERALGPGGTGINPAVEQQVWERDRARIMSETQRMESEATVTFANRRFPLPPGAMVSQLNAIAIEGSRKLAEQSRDIAIKSFEAELENVRLAVQQAIDLRMKGLQAAGDYIRTLILGPQTAMQLATGLAGLRAEFARALTSMYSAQVTAVEPLVRLNITDAQLKQAAAEANLRAQVQSITDRVNAADSNARMVGSIASSSLNGMNVQASISGSDSSSI